MAGLSAVASSCAMLDDSGGGDVEHAILNPPERKPRKRVQDASSSSDS